jgi:hypothetical protein
MVRDLQSRPGVYSMQAKLKNEADNLSLDGLEGLLDADEPAQSAGQISTANSGNLEIQDWTVEETATALGLSRGAVIRRLEDGILSGYRVKRGSRLVWRVRPTWLAGASHKGSAYQDEPENVQSPDLAAVAPAADAADSQHSSADAAEACSSFDCQEVVEAFDIFQEAAELPALPASVRELIELSTRLEMTESQFQDACQKLELANYKIGYLEARLEASQEQVRLLCDSQAKGSWWRRWRQWFFTVTD